MHEAGASLRRNKVVQKLLYSFLWMSIDTIPCPASSPGASNWSVLSHLAAKPTEYHRRHNRRLSQLPDFDWYCCSPCLPRSPSSLAVLTVSLSAYLFVSSLEHAVLLRQADPVEAPSQPPERHEAFICRRRGRR